MLTLRIDFALRSSCIKARLRKSPVHQWRSHSMRMRETQLWKLLRIGVPLVALCQVRLPLKRPVNEGRYKRWCCQRNDRSMTLIIAYKVWLHRGLPSLAQKSCDQWLLNTSALRFGSRSSRNSMENATTRFVASFPLNARYQ